MISRPWSALLVGLLSLAAGVAPAAPSAPGTGRAVFLLYDTSGSLRGVDLAAAAQAGRELLADLAPGDRAGVMRFDDAPAVLAPLGSPSAALPALAALKLGGTRTALYDALYDASRLLGATGTARRVVILFSDGRDEDSALMFEDVARAAVASGVVVDVVGVGPRQDERTLRRLAKLTHGAYYRSTALANPGEFAVAVLAALDTAEVVEDTPVALAPEATLPAAAAPATPAATPFASPSATPAATPPAADAAPSPRSRGRRLALIVVALALLAALVALVALLLRGRAKPVTPDKPRPQGPASTPTMATAPRESAIAGSRDFLLTSEVMTRDTARFGPGAVPPDVAEAPAATVILPSGPADAPEPLELAAAARGSKPFSDDEALDRTFVLKEVPVLAVRKGRNLGEIFLLRQNGSTYIGRSKVNEIRVVDDTVSSQHCQIRGEGAIYTVVDLHSTNGCFVNQERVQDERMLQVGDVVRVGETEFVFKLEQHRG